MRHPQAGFSSRGAVKNSPSPAALPGAAKRKRVVLYGVGILVAVFAVLSPTIFYQPPVTDLKVAGQTVVLEIARSAAAQEKGLSGRASMPADKGMIFVQDPPAATCFWMKDMHFSIDIVWLDGTKKVMYLQQNVSPKTYPKSFCPTSSAKYVIELHAGQVQKLGIHLGQTLKF